MTPKKKIYLLCSILGAIFLAIIFLVILPIFREIETTKIEIKKRKENIDNLSGELQNIQDFRKKYLKGGELAEIRNFFVKSEFPIEFITFLEKEAKEVKINLEISPISFSKEKNSLGFTLKGFGEFPQFLSFLENLEKAPYLIEIEDLNIARKKEEVSKNQISFSITIYVATEIQ